MTHPALAPAPTSNIPVLKMRNVSSEGPQPHAARKSLEIGVRTKEGFIKNELPPFRVFPGEALRIAQRGHEPDINGPRGVENEGGQQEDGGDEGDGEGGSSKRKRAVTMRNSPTPPGKASSGSGGSASRLRPGSSRQNSWSSDGKSSHPVVQSGRPATSSTSTASRTLPRSALGVGHPTPRKTSAPVRTPTSRIGTTNPAPRSASLNMLASPTSSSGTPTPTSSRLGVAAHFIPPEASYTPPKGLNWDEVVLPVVAKKLGIGEGERGRERVEERGEREDELAVEWDREGTPIKWVKRSGARRGDGTGDEGNVRIGFEVG